MNEFAREWGFFETPFHIEHTVEKVREFTESIGKDGKWMGEPIEGFVVRCYVKDGLASGDRDAPPYPPGASFFFKVKYDEPYMTYRDWREITKMVLGDRSPPKSKLRRPESTLYLEWVREEIERRPRVGVERSHGRALCPFIPPDPPDVVVGDHRARPLVAVVNLRGGHNEAVAGQPLARPFDRTGGG